MADRIEEGDPCPNCGDGRLECFQPDDCTCFLNPPCTPCVERGMKCNACGWQLGDELDDAPIQTEEPNDG
jgi:hypothetical protein